jgi:hypothetical protein
MFRFRERKFASTNDERISGGHGNPPLPLKTENWIPRTKKSAELLLPIQNLIKF